jgi:hypothetical protein
MTSNRGEEAADRARAAARRIEELEERNKRLEAGETSTPDDVARAKAAAEKELRESERAHERASSAHKAAASRHRDAATLLDQTDHHDQAEEHRQAATRDDAAANES